MNCHSPIMGNRKKSKAIRLGELNVSFITAQCVLTYMDIVLMYAIQFQNPESPTCIHGPYCPSTLQQAYRLKNGFTTTVPLACWAYNNAFHRSTNETPFFSLFMRDNFILADVFRPAPPNYSVGLLDDYVTETFVKFRRMCVDIANQQESAAEERSRFFNARAKPKKLVPGEKCYVKINAQPGHLTPKLCRAFDGPFRVLDVLGEVTYRVKKCIPLSRVEALPRVVHANQIRQCPPVLRPDGAVPASIAALWAEDTRYACSY